MNDLFRLGLIQCELAWHNPKANVNHLAEQILHASEDADLWVIPEMFTTGFTMQPTGLAINETPELLHSIQEICIQKQCRIAGSFIWKNADAYTNRFILFGPGGIEHFYDKRHLFGYAKEDAHYQSGTLKTSFTLNGWVIAPYVCYDLRFPEWIRNDGSVDLTLFVANWPGTRASHWRTLLIARAIENQCFVAGVNRVGTDGNGLGYTGGSLCVDANGEILKELNAGAETTVITLSQKTLQTFKANFPFLKDRS